MLDPQLQRRFLEQLRALEQFRITYVGEQPGVPLDRADQDVQRLLEAQAFFSARTSVAAERGLTRGMRRLFAQHFPYLLSPIPGASMLQARIDGSFIDALHLRSGEELGVVEAPSVDLEDPPSPLILRTMAALEIRPLELSSVRFETSRHHRGARLELSLEASYGYGQPASVGPVAIHIDHLGELKASAAVFLALRTSLVQASVRWDGRGEEFACPVRFGSLPVDGEPRVALEHPLERARSFFALPEMDLFMTLDVPPAPRPWTSFTVDIELSQAWPRGLSVEGTSMHLHVVPAVNLKRELAAPLTFDGTRSEHAIGHPDALGSFVLHDVRGAYRLDDAEGLVPITPGFVPEGGIQGSDLRWETDIDGYGAERRGRLRMCAPEALEDPFRVSVDACWHQPRRTVEVGGGAEAELLHRSLHGLSFEVRGRIRPAMDSPLVRDDDALLALLGVRSRRMPDLSDLKILMDSLRTPGDRVFGPLLEGLTRADIHSVPSARAASGFRYRYLLRFDRLGPDEVPLIALFGRRLREVLEAWSTEEVVEVFIELPHLERSFEYRNEAQS